MCEFRLNTKMCEHRPSAFLNMSRQAKLAVRGGDTVERVRRFDYMIKNIVGVGVGVEDEHSNQRRPVSERRGVAQWQCAQLLSKPYSESSSLHLYGHKMWSMLWTALQPGICCHAFIYIKNYCFCLFLFYTLKKN